MARKKIEVSRDSPKVSKAQRSTYNLIKGSSKSSRINSMGDKQAAIKKVGDKRAHAAQGMLKDMKKDYEWDDVWDAERSVARDRRRAKKKK